MHAQLCDVHQTQMCLAYLSIEWFLHDEASLVFVRKDSPYLRWQAWYWYAGIGTKRAVRKIVVVTKCSGAVRVKFVGT